ncbi:MAG: hypothetical protein JST00_05065 [Deltaproteobacteria bacterium]|nr:hypothetical protein [Deltaproteobacteria bacterium]
MKRTQLDTYFRSLCASSPLPAERDGDSLASPRLAPAPPGAALREILADARELARRYDMPPGATPPHVLFAIADGVEDDLFLYALPESVLDVRASSALATLHQRTIAAETDATRDQWAAWALVSAATGRFSSAAEAYEAIVEPGAAWFDEGGLPSMHDLEAWHFKWVPYFGGRTTFSPDPKRLDVSFSRLVVMARDA